MRIVVQVTNIPHYFAARLREFLSCDAEIMIVCAQEAGEFSEFVYAPSLAGLPIQRLTMRSLAEKSKAMEATLDEFDPDVVVITGWASRESYLAISAARKSGRRLVVMSESQAEDHSRSSLRELVKSRVVRCCDAALVGGEPHRDYIVSLGIPKENVFLGYDAVDNTHFENGAARARDSADTVRLKHDLPGRYLLASARFIPKKNLMRLVEAFARATVGQAEYMSLVILGDGPERPALEEAIAKGRCVDRVYLVGFRSYDVLPDYYGLADGFVHISTTEQWGLVANEAAAAGIPLLLSKTCGAAKHLVLEGENGFCVNPEDIDEITAKLRMLISLSPQQRKAMGRRGQEIAADWGPKRFASGLFAACEAAMKQSPRPLSLWDRWLLAFLARYQPRQVA